MRIIQVTPAFYPCQIWGGVPPVVDSLSKGLRSRGHDVLILTSNILDYEHRIHSESFIGEWEGTPVLYIKTHWKGRKKNSVGFIWMPDMWHYRHIIRDADIVHIHGYRTYIFMMCAMISLYYKVPYIVQPQGSLPARFGRVTLKKIFDRTVGKPLLQRVSGGIVLHNGETEDFMKFGVQRARITKIFNVFDAPVYVDSLDGNQFRQRYAIGCDEKILLFLGRLHTVKGPDLLIKAVAELEHEDIRLCLVGPDDGSAQIVRDMIQQLGLQERVIMTGPLYNEEKFEAYRAADIFVLPTRAAEGFPVAVVEALFAGVPIIVSRTTEAAAIVDGRAGIAVDRNVKSLKKAIAYLLDHPEIREEYRRNTAEIMQEYFNPEAALDCYEEFYNMCASQR